MNEPSNCDYLSGKTVLVTGGTGSIGRELVRHILGFGPAVVRVLSRNEFNQYRMAQELEGHKNLRFLLGDVREHDRVMRAVEGVDVIFHAAALKHVPACEYNPFEAVKTNVVGTQNLIEAAIQHSVSRLISISTDKAVSPTNTMGATKLLAERLVLAAALIWAVTMRISGVIPAPVGALAVIVVLVNWRRLRKLSGEAKTNAFAAQRLYKHFLHQAQWRSAVLLAAAIVLLTLLGWSAG